MNIKQYLDFKENKFICSTDTLFISYNEQNPNEWESLIINLLTKQQFKNLNTLNNNYPLSLQLNLPITSTNHKLTITNPNSTTVLYTEEIEEKKLLKTTHLKYKINTNNYHHKLLLNPHTLTQEINATPVRIHRQTFTLNPQHNINNTEYSEISPYLYQLLNTLRNNRDIDPLIFGEINHPDNTNHREIYDWE